MTAQVPRIARYVLILGREPARQARANEKPSANPGPKDAPSAKTARLYERIFDAWYLWMINGEMLRCDTDNILVVNYCIYGHCAPYNKDDAIHDYSAVTIFTKKKHSNRILKNFMLSSGA